MKDLSLNEAETFIENNLSEELINSSVQLTLLEARPIKVSVVGEVSRPGIYTLSSASSNDLPNVSTAIETAGGLSRNANLKIGDSKRKITQ